MSVPIVVGVDGSASALSAVEWAAEEAGRHRVPLKLVHAYLMPSRGYPELVLTGHEVRQALEDQGRQWLAEAEAAARAAADVEVTVSLEHSGAAGAMVWESKRARLVVLGSRGLGGFTGLLVGSVAVAAVAHGECPVVVVRDSVPAEGPVVVGVDGSPASEQAVAFAFDAASTRGAVLKAVLAGSDFVVDGPYGDRLAVDWAAVEDEERRVLAERLAGWQEKYPDVRVDRVVVRERPARALLTSAADAQLLVVGSRGRGGFKGMLLGSTSQTLVHHAPCPVAVVRPPAVD
ncbi:nucleotide-binding universal stress UspA family protein [Saccharothrix tamanrassetensis]|uniref:Nucleotide-binding universal stress UspA family protein n=1 Tax=Saccharothrix tamanrassetensis TaxID=1051531 RepID=A0A841CR75_9PSEU|nr:universal stress protein [Saccharothrix tamanrassetensis]MBB5957996.1 nucleotide-binding universal stress UspA family protein [Saccharothrix tamanrassetensis]